MRYVRKMWESPSPGAPAGTDWTRIQYAFDQPLVDRLRYKVYHAWWLVAWKVKPIDWVIDHLADPVYQWRHKRSCDGECTKRYDQDGNMDLICARMPLTAAMDCKLYTLDHRNNTNVKRL